MKSISSVISLLLLAVTGTSSAQSLSDLTSDFDQFGFNVPGIACKTRTNNDGSVRNLAHGVWNRDSNALVALNCGWPVPHAWVDDKFPSDARINGAINLYTVRSAGTTNATANQAFCSISVSNKEDTAQNPNSNGVLIGTLEPIFTAATNVDERDIKFISTSGVLYPSGGRNFFSAFCRIPRGVRVQVFSLNAESVNDGY